MKREDAAKLVKDTFSNEFKEDRYRFFVRNLFNDLDESKAFAYHGSYIPDAYKNHVRQYKRIGKYTDPEGTELDVLIVYLKKETSLEKARTMQRNFIAYYLKNRGEKDAAIVAFCTDGLEDWRFSYVRMDYKTVQTESGKVKVKEELTPARRYSFLVGKNEPNHTAQQRLVPLLEDDKNNPTLSVLEKAFNIESVTKEFFNKYKGLFLKVHEELDAVVAADKKIRKEFEDKLVDTANFAKKLLGQIVFLYFIQKKGWLGVARDKAWGTGPRNFMRLLHEKAVVDYENFFNDILEPLFYEALAIDRGEVSLYSRFKCKIPFLNGGLFEPVNGYNWEETDILLKNETFAEILGTFDLYNFTVREDEPLEREVAVDPEMLGKVFENLLEVKDRKSKGAYYTPREIVHYMCQQSLISYLDSALNGGSIGYERMTSPQSVLFGQDELPPADDQLELMAKVGAPSIPRQDIELFVRQGDFGIQNDLTVEEKGKETPRYSYKLPEAIRINAGRIDKTLADIQICDPAIGSGAFPVGMLHEIVRARDTLTTYFPSMESIPHKSPTLAKGGEGGFVNERTPYNFKRHAIQESIYGVDIDPGAVDIAKLRLWLSLVVDEDDFRTIKPLPNLDYKIVCGNTLDGFPFQSSGLQELEELKFRFFEETSPTRKKALKTKIDERLQAAFAASAKSIGYQVTFDVKMMFSEVFHAKKGFDVVIANPPYVRQEAIKEIKPMLKKQFGTFFSGTADLYTYFYKRGLEILRPSGHLCFIAPNKFMRAGYGKNTRALLTTDATPKIVIDFCELPVFEAGTDPAIVLVEKFKPAPDSKLIAAIIKTVQEIEWVSEVVAERGFAMKTGDLSVDGWTLESANVLVLMEKLRKAGKPLGEYVQGRFYRGILTGLNEAFVIDEETRKKLIAEDPNSEDLIKPWLRGRDIRKWKTEWAGLYVIFTRRGVDIEKYLAIKGHLELFRKNLEPKKSEKQKHGRKPGAYKWYEIQDNIAYYQEFEQPKIVYADIAKLLRASYDTSGAFCANTLYILPTNDLAILGFLHSRLFDWYARYNFQALGDALEGGRLRFIAQYMELVPFPVASDSQKVPIIKRVSNILANPDSPDVPRLEAEINKLVYALYDLTPEEIEIVEGKK